MPTSTRRSRVLEEEANEEGGVGTRSTRSTRSKGGSNLEDSLPSPPRKKTKRAGDKSAKAAESDGGRKDSSPSKDAQSKSTKAATSKLSDESRDSDSEEGQKEESSTSSTTPGEKPSSIAVCKICGKNAKEDAKPMIVFEKLGTFHVFCGRIAAISSSNKMPEYEIAEKSILKKQFGVSAAVNIAFDQSLTAICMSNGKKYVSVPDFHRHLARFKSHTTSPGRRFNTKQPPVPEAPSPRRTKKVAATKKKATKQGQRRVPIPPPSFSSQQRDPLVEQAIANAMSRRMQQESSNEDAAPRRKPCVCGHSDCYTVLERWVKVGDDKRCGYVSLPAWSTKDTNRGKLVNQFRELVFLNLRGDKNLAKEKASRKFVAFHHFELSQLLPGNKGLVEFIEPDFAEKILYLPLDYQIARGPNKGKYLPSPRRPWPDMINELVSIERRKSTAAPSHSQTGQGALDARPQPPANAGLGLEDNQRLEQLLSKIPEDYERLKALYVETEKALALERKKSRDLHAELSKTYAELSNTKLSMHQMYANQAQLKKLVANMSNVVQKM